jgi:pimeloyl-ACP methyl ester carboxylesterase
VLVLLHGWAHNLRTWDEVVPAFAPRFRVVRLDRRGFGRSTGHADPTADPSDVAQLLDYLGIASAHVLGHSAGGGVALSFALAYPSRLKGLILYGATSPAGFGLPWDGSDSFPDLRQMARQQGMDSVRAVMSRLGLVPAPESRREIVARHLAQLWSMYSGRDLLEDHPPSNKVPFPRPH